MRPASSPTVVSLKSALSRLAARFGRQVRRVAGPFATVFPKADPALYVLWCAVFTLSCARMFYGYMLKQTSGEWSAPLDDVFIHFDYARSAASGHPFQWVVGNGYSSGDTSLLYPFVLAAGYVGGYTGASLMVWAAVVASTATFALLLAARSLFFRTGHGRPTATPDRWARLSSYLLAPFLLGVGALDWSLWSGMEVALFLALWGGAMRAYLDVEEASLGDGDAENAACVALGAWCAALVVTRPEAVTTVAVFAVASAIAVARGRGRLASRARQLKSNRVSWGARRTLFTVVAVFGPAATLMVVQAIANRYFTGEWSANGALVKLAINNPFLTRTEKVSDYSFNLTYAVLRNTEYHFTDIAAYGVILPALGLLTLAYKRTRSVALVIWAQLALWLGMVALNGQVRWQNERYTMPAVAWLLVLSALGTSALLRRRERPNFAVVVGIGFFTVELLAMALRPVGAPPAVAASFLTAVLGAVALAIFLRPFPARGAIVVAAVALAYIHQVPRMREQKWFFGRASRNIRDQHVRAGQFLGQLAPERVLVGDAGALMYVSQRKGLDIIGLGGYHDLPFARASVHGLPATLELIERMDPKERPDVFAIYPTWWGVLPTWFTKRILASFPVEGNVICGGYEKVIYEADFHVLGTGEAPRRLPEGESVRDSVDIADLVSEKEHGYAFPTPAGGWTAMKIFSDPADATQDLFDGGRRIDAGLRETFHVRHLIAGRAAHLVVRSAPESDVQVRVRVAGEEAGTLAFSPDDGWSEREVALPGRLVSEDIAVEFVNAGPGVFSDYHVWATQ